MIVTCHVCSSSFVAKRSTRMYCSDHCKRVGAAAKRLDLRRCEVCDSTYQPVKATSRTCSPRCRNTLNSRTNLQQRAEAQRGTGTADWYVKRNGRHEHRVVAEQMLGRPLRDGEVVHHRNGDKKDNRPENLEVLPSQAEHARLHMNERWRAQREAA